MENTELTVKLVPEAVADLEAEKAASEMNSADVVNRALRLYHFMMKEERVGNQMHLKDNLITDGFLFRRVSIVPDHNNGENDAG